MLGGAGGSSYGRERASSSHIPMPADGGAADCRPLTRKAAHARQAADGTLDNALAIVDGTAARARHLHQGSPIYG